MSLLDSLASPNSPDWLARWRQLNSFSGDLTNSTFAPNVLSYTPEEYQKAGINLIPVTGRTVKFQPMQWQAALDKARLQIQLDQSQAATQAAQQSQSAQDTILTEADKAAEAVKSNARKAIGRRATILTSPMGVLQQSSQAGTTLLGG